MKTITICDKEYKIDCNAFTLIQFKKVFNRGIFEDIKILKEYLIKQTIKLNQLKDAFPNMTEDEISKELGNFMIDDIDDFIEAITRIAYILMYTVDENIVSYEEWLKNIKKLSIDDDWIVEVTEFAVDCFC